MDRHYEFVAVGGGSAGFNAARAALKYADRVAVIDGAKELGGLCILRGCMPSKTLIYVSDVQHHARQATLLGLNVNVGIPDMQAVQARKKRIIAEFADFRAEQLQSAKFDLIRATARFAGPNTLKLSDGSTITANRILIGTGSRVSWPDIPGLGESRPWTSDNVLDLDFVPESVAVLGGGVVACELAQFLVRMGARVVQIQRSPQILKSHSREAVSPIEQALRDDGIELYTDTQLKRVSFGSGEYEIRFRHQGREIVRSVRHCVNALGREPDIAELGLESAGIKTSERGNIITKEFQQTSAPGVYAAGDCTGPHEIVHVAIQQAEVAVKHAFGQPVDPMDYSNLLQVVFTDPQLATVGPTGAELDADGVSYVSASYPFDDHGKSILMEAKYGQVRVLADPTYGRIIAAEITGKDAGEMIHVFAIAVTAKLTVWDLLKAPWYHPTLTEILTYPLEEIAEQVGQQ